MDRLSTTVHPERSEGATLVALRGTVTAATEGKLRNVLRAIFATGPSAVLVDLTAAVGDRLSILSRVRHQNPPAALIPLVPYGRPGRLPDEAAARAYLHAGRSDGTHRWIRLPASAEAPAAAREFAVTAGRQWGRSRLLDRLELIASELASNGVQHAAGTPLLLTLVDGGDGLLVGVRDGSPGRPGEVTPPVAPMAAAGRGLRMVAACAGDWGVAAGPTGKLVWASLAAN